MNRDNTDSGQLEMAEDERGHKVVAGGSGEAMTEKQWEIQQEMAVGGHAMTVQYLQDLHRQAVVELKRMREENSALRGMQADSGQFEFPCPREPMSDERFAELRRQAERACMHSDPTSSFFAECYDEIGRLRNSVKTFPFAVEHHRLEVENRLREAVGFFLSVLDGKADEIRQEEAIQIIETYRKLVQP
jgi:hypothetical protein